MSWLTFLVIISLALIVVLWSALYASKRKDDPIYFELDKFPPEFALKE